VEQVKPRVDGLVLRLAAPADAAMLCALGLRTFTDAFAANNDPHDFALYVAEAFTPERFESELRDPNAWFVVGEIDDKAIGYAKLVAGAAPPCVSDPAAMEIARFYVERAWHGRGVADALMQRCLDEARLRHHSMIWLGVWELNPRARAFYRRWGFREVGEHPFKFGSQVQSDLVMERTV
jgi:ribosomal protein S18 acetylase RimI-like enzyme